MKNELGRTLFLAGSKVQFDAQCKKVLSQKIVLAWILKYTMEEFSALSPDAIAGCIEEDPEVSVARVNPGETNTERIFGGPNESREPGEGEIYYDIRFFVYVPGDRETIRMIINVEAQKSFYPGYEIVTRGIFYTARMISAQLGTEFSIPDYDGMKKVCSIWICMNAPRYIGNTLTEYYFIKNDIEGRQPDKLHAYSKMMVCVVTLNENIVTNNRFLQFLNVLLSVQKTCEEKEKILKNRFHIKLDAGLRKELNLMCNLSEYVYERGMRHGRKSGIRYGKRAGKREGRREVLRDVVKAMLDEGYPEKAILQIVRMTPEELEKLRAEI